MNTASPQDDLHYMRMALALGERMLGQTWPNPSVGCVLVKDGRIVGRGITQKGGRPHAETEALKQAGEQAKDATAYISLEPCAHTGKTGPCTKALIEAGIARVVIPLRDADERVSGHGVRMLREEGIAVTEGVCAPEAEQAHRGFFMRVTEKRPLVALKAATTLDGKVATRTGESQWITGPQSLQFSHKLRASYDAILIGSGTLMADDPQLTCRLNGLQHRSPVRIVLDTRLRITPDHKLVQTIKDAPLWVLTSQASLEAQAEKQEALTAKGVRLLGVDIAHGKLTPASVLATLADEGLTRVLIEGGPSVASVFLQSNLVDECWWFTAPHIIGDDGLGVIKPIGITTLGNCPHFTVLHQQQLGQDAVLHLRIDRSPALEEKAA